MIFYLVAALILTYHSAACVWLGYRLGSSRIDTE